MPSIAVVVYLRDSRPDGPFPSHLRRLTRLSIPLILLREKERISFNRRGKDPREEEAPADRTIFENLEELAQARKLEHLVLVDPRALFLDVKLLRHQIREHLKRDADYTYPFELPLGIGADVMSSGLLKRLAGLGELSEPQVSPWIGAHAGMAQSENLKIVNLDAGEAGIRERYPSGRVLLEGSESWRRARRTAAAKKRGGTDALIRFWREQDGILLSRAKERARRALAARFRRKDRRISVCSLILNFGNFQSSAPRIGMEIMQGTDAGRFRHSALVPYRGPVLDEIRRMGIPRRVFAQDPGWSLRCEGNLDVLPPAWFWPQTADFLNFFVRNETRILHAHTYFKPAWTAARLLRIPVVFHCHGSLSARGAEPDGSQLWKKEGVDWMAADRVLCCSDWVAEGLRDLGLPSGCVEVVPNGVDVGRLNPERFDRAAIRAKLGARPEDILLLAAGRLDADRRLELLLAALRLLPPRAPRFKLLLAGRPSDPAYGRGLEQIVRTLGLEGRVAFLGFRDDLPDLLAAADVAVNPRTGDPFPRASLEALAMGLPLAASRSGGLPEMVESGRSGILFDPENPKSLAAALARLIANPALRRRMGRAARERAVRSFPLDRFTRRIEKVWTRLGRRP